jgi:hypothetical protein
VIGGLFQKGELTSLSPLFLRKIKKEVFSDGLQRFSYLVGPPRSGQTPSGLNPVWMELGPGTPHGSSRTELLLIRVTKGGGFLQGQIFANSEERRIPICQGWIGTRRLHELAINTMVCRWLSNRGNMTSNN